MAFAKQFIFNTAQNFGLFLFFLLHIDKRFFNVLLIDLLSVF